MEYIVNCVTMKMKHDYITTIEMIVGTAMTALAIGRFIIPQGFAVAGVTGFSSVVIGVLPLSLSQMVLLVNAFFLLMGLLFEGKAFVLKTAGVSLLFPVLLQMFTADCPLQNAVYSALVGGLLLGTGTGLLLRSGASSGGFAVAAVILKNRLNIPAAAVLNICDAAVILMQAMHSTALQTIYGVFAITVSALVVNQIEKLPTRPFHIPVLRENARF